MTFKRPLVSEIPKNIIELISENNKLDQKLYDFCLDRFQTKTSSLNNKNITFIKDKYNHVIPYCLKWCFFEFCLDNKKFLKVNFEYFKSLTFFLIKDKKITDGKTYTKSWNNSFINEFSESFKGSLLSLEITNSYKKGGDPFEELIKIAEIIDSYLKDTGGDRTNYYKPLKFNTENIILEKNSFLSLFFKS